MGKNIIYVIGTIWMPPVTGATEYNPSQHDVENMRDDDGYITRESVSRWLDSHAGDFQSVDDFDALITTREKVTVMIPWQDEDNGLLFGDLMYPEDAE